MAMRKGSKSEPISVKVAVMDMMLAAWDAISNWLADDAERRLKVYVNEEGFLVYAALDGEKTIARNGSVSGLASDLKLAFIREDLMALLRLEVEDN